MEFRRPTEAEVMTIVAEQELQKIAKSGETLTPLREGELAALRRQVDAEDAASPTGLNQG